MSEIEVLPIDEADEPPPPPISPFDKMIQVLLELSAKEDERLKKMDEQMLKFESMLAELTKIVTNTDKVP